MDFETTSHRNAEIIFANDARYTNLYNEVVSSIRSISDQDLINAFNNSERENIKSLSEPINNILKNRLTALGWQKESAIFNDPQYRDSRDKKRWRLDFAKDEISLEVAFNHGEAIAWNLLKPVMASELNHVEKAIQTSAGIIICATKKLKNIGGFDNSVGEYEKFLRYFNPMYNLLTSPILLIGLKAPTTFRIKHLKSGNTTYGEVEMLNR